MEDAMRLRGGEFVGGLFRRRGDDVVIVVEDEDSVTLHELRLRDQEGVDTTFDVP